MLNEITLTKHFHLDDVLPVVNLFTVLAHRDIARELELLNWNVEHFYPGVKQAKKKLTLREDWRGLIFEYKHLKYAALRIAYDAIHDRVFARIDVFLHPTKQQREYTANLMNK